MPKVFCAQCEKQIKGRYFQNKEGASLCRDCAEGNAGSCFVCGETMLGSSKGLKIDGKPIHRECFNCVDCQEPIGESGFQMKARLCVDESRRELFTDKDLVCSKCAKKFRKAEKALRDQEHPGEELPEEPPVPEGGEMMHEKRMSLQLQEMNEAVMLAAGNANARPVSGVSEEAGDADAAPEPAPARPRGVSHQKRDRASGVSEERKSVSRVSQRLEAMNEAVVMAAGNPNARPVSGASEEADADPAPQARKSTTKSYYEAGAAARKSSKLAASVPSQDEERLSGKLRAMQEAVITATPPPASQEYPDVDFDHRASGAASRASRKSKQSQSTVNTYTELPYPGSAESTNYNPPSRPSTRPSHASGKGGSVNNIVCALCQKKIKEGDETCKTGAGVVFHKACFTCTKCKTSISGSFVRGKDGKLICQKCVPVCAGCKKPLSGQVLAVGDKAYHVSNPVDGSCCFKCHSCSKSLLAGYFDDPQDEDRKLCATCYGGALEDEENAKHQEEEAQQRESNQKLELYNGCVWSDGFRGRSADVANLFSTAGAGVVEGKMCLSFNEQAGESAAALNVIQLTDPTKNSNAVVNLEYLVLAAQFFSANDDAEPIFSLDPFDPEDMGGPYQVKKFVPKTMVESSFGEVIFQADYFLKKACFGEIEMPESFGATLFDMLDEHPLDHSGVRQWFVIENASVSIGPNGVLVPDCELAVEAREFRFDQNSGRYLDKHDFDRAEDDIATVHAQKFTEHMEDIMAVSPELQELMQVAKAMVLVKYLCTSKKLNVTGPALRYGPRSVLDEINRVRKQNRLDKLATYQMKIPTLTKYASVTAVQEDSKRNTITKSQVHQTVFGGIDLEIGEIEEIVLADPVPTTGQKIAFAFATHT